MNALITTRIIFVKHVFFKNRVTKSAIKINEDTKTSIDHYGLKSGREGAMYSLTDLNQ